MQEIYIEKTFNAPVAKVFAELSDHEKLSVVLGANIKRIRDGQDGHTNGKGSVREIRLAPGLSFEETVTAFTPEKLVEYVISKGSPLKNHKGTMEFTEANGGTRLRYRIVFESKLPIPFFGDITRVGLKTVINRGLDKFAKKIA